MVLEMVLVDECGPSEPLGPHTLTLDWAVRCAQSPVLEEVRIFTTRRTICLKSAHTHGLASLVSLAGLGP